MNSSNDISLERPAPRAIAGGLLAMTASIVVMLLLAQAPWMAWLRDREAIQAWEAGFGIWAPLAGVALGVFQVVGLPLPAPVMALANGYLFGAAMGSVVGLVGGALGGLVCISVVRLLGRPALARLLGPKGMRWLDYFAGHPNLLGAALIAFLVPGIPDNMIFFALGLGERPILPVMALAVAVRLPIMLVLPYVGAHAGAFLG